MERILIIADDLTGTLDTAIPFVLRGARVEVCRVPPAAITSTADVVAINGECRHASPQKARDIVRGIAAMGRAAGFERILKKVDSLLRGNPAREIRGAMEGSGFAACFFSPALPAQGRIIRNGRLCGVENSGSGPELPVDSLHPVPERDLFSLLAPDLPVPLRSELHTAEQPGIVIADATSEDELYGGVKSAFEAGFRLFSGSSGMGAALARVLIPDMGNQCALRPDPPDIESPLLILAGSHNAVSRTQIGNLLESGAAVLVETATDTGNGTKEHQDIRKCRSLLESGYTTILATRPVREISPRRARLISRTLAQLAVRLLPFAGSVMVLGGDSLNSFLAALGIASVIPLAEPAPGTVSFSLPTKSGSRTILSRSGAFGGPDYLRKLLQEAHSHETYRDQPR